MAITLNADRTQIRLCTDNTDPNNGQQLQTCIAQVAITNPGPVKPHSTQNNSAGNVLVNHCAQADTAKYLGYNIVGNRAAGEPLGVFKGVTVDGFEGCTPGSPVYIAAATADADLVNAPNASGLTHTPDTGQQPIGVALSATKIRFH